MYVKAIVIGVSAGGLEVLKKILPLLPAEIPPIMIIQHVSSFSDGFVVQFFDELCEAKVVEVQEREKIEPNHIYFAPPNYHVLLEENLTFSLTTTERVHYARPSIDVLFESAAEVFQNHIIGIILTGANSDGSYGLSMVNKFGGITIVQDPQEAFAPVMPYSAIRKAGADFVLPADSIASKILSLIEEGKTVKFKNVKLI